jgi:hypothetical protein
MPQIIAKKYAKKIKVGRSLGTKEIIFKNALIVQIWFPIALSALTTLQ